MGTKFTRRRFLKAAGAGATYLALANTVGCEPAERSSKASPAKTSQPVGAVAYGPQPAPQLGAWTFRSRPDLSPPAVEVTTQAHNTAPGHIFVSPEKGGAGEGGSLIVDNRGQVVWFRP